MAKRSKRPARDYDDDDEEEGSDLMLDDDDLNGHEHGLDDDDDDLDEMEEGEDEEDEDTEGEEGGAPQQAPKKKKKGSQRPDREPIYDVDGMHEKLEDVGWADGVPWEETQVITHDDPEQVENVDDDMARELAFYKQALSAAQQAIVRFDKAGVAWLRPRDYYAEMVKSDQHMAKVKEQLMHEQRAIEQAEERRKAREAKQYAKQVQAEKQKERNQAKKSQIEQVSKLRKQRDKAGYAGEFDFDAELDAMDKGGRQQQQRFGGKMQDRGAGGKGRLPPSRKRQARDAKFGYGGSKKLRKQNDAYSAADVDGRKQGRFNGGGGGGGSGGGAKHKGGFNKGGPPGKGGGKGNVGGPRKQQMKRPGKQARQQRRGGGQRAK